MKTGKAIVKTLILVDKNTEVPILDSTGNIVTKQNLPSDPSYISPYFDDALCGVVVPETTTTTIDPCNPLVLGFNMDCGSLTFNTLKVSFASNTQDVMVIEVLRSNAVVFVKADVQIINGFAYVQIPKSITGNVVFRIGKGQCSIAYNFVIDCTLLTTTLPAPTTTLPPPTTTLPTPSTTLAPILAVFTIGNVDCGTDIITTTQPVTTTQPAPTTTLPITTTFNPCFANFTLNSVVAYNLNNIVINITAINNADFEYRFYIVSNGVPNMVKNKVANGITPGTFDLVLSADDYHFDNGLLHAFTFYGANCAEPNPLDHTFTVPVSATTTLPGATTTLPATTTLGATTTLAPVVVTTASLVFDDDAGIIKSYNPATNTISTLFSEAYSTDIGHTANKLFLNMPGGIVREYDITLNPFTKAFARDYNIIANTGSGLTAVSDTVLYVASTVVTKITILGIGSNKTETKMFDLPAGFYCTGDIVYDTTTQRFLISYHNPTTNVYRIGIFNNSGTILRSVAAPTNDVYAMYQYLGNTYILTGSNSRYLLNLVTMAITAQSAIGVNAYGGSQLQSNVTIPA